jgi:hypothetical protein
MPPKRKCSAKINREEVKRLKIENDNVSERKDKVQQSLEKFVLVKTKPEEDSEEDKSVEQSSQNESQNEDQKKVLLSLLNSPPKKEDEYLYWFRSLCSIIMNSFAIQFGKCKARITELEPYYNDDGKGKEFAKIHIDDTTHCNELQRTFGTWYFHRTGTFATSGFKTISYLGLDMCFGSKFCAFGILIRAIEIIEPLQPPKQEYEYGPSNSLTKRVFPELGVPHGSVKEKYHPLMRTIEKTPIFENTILKLVPHHFTDQQKVIFAPRIGLGTKKKFSLKPYRYMIMIKKKHLQRREIDEFIKQYKQ